MRIYVRWCYVTSVYQRTACSLVHWPSAVYVMSQDHPNSLVALHFNGQFHMVSAQAAAHLIRAGVVTVSTSDGVNIEWGTYRHSRRLLDLLKCFYSIWNKWVEVFITMAVGHRVWFLFTRVGTLFKTKGRPGMCLKLLEEKHSLAVSSVIDKISRNSTLALPPLNLANTKSADTFASNSVTAPWLGSNLTPPSDPCMDFGLWVLGLGNPKAFIMW